MEKAFPIKLTKTQTGGFLGTLLATCLIDCNNFASPDLNPIGKSFNVEKQELKKQSLDIV